MRISNRIAVLASLGFLPALAGFPSSGGTTSPAADLGLEVPETVEAEAEPDEAGFDSLADAPAEVPELPHDTVIPVPYIPAGSVRFEPGGREGDLVLVNVVARSFDAVSGIALRVEWDAGLLELAETVPEPLFGAQDQDAVYRAAELRPGQLALGMAVLGSGGEKALVDDVKVATLKFRVRKAAPAGLSFFAPRCLLVHGRLEKIEVTYLNATVYP